MVYTPCMERRFGGKGPSNSCFVQPTISGRWRYPACFLGTIAATLAAQVVCPLLFSESQWSWRTVYGSAFQAALLLGAFLFCAKPPRLLALIFLVEAELLACDALKLKYLRIPLAPRDVFLLPEFLGLMRSLVPLKQAGFYALLAIIPLTWIGGAIMLIRCRRRPRLGETVWLVPLLAFAIWLTSSPGSYRRAVAGLVGEEPILRRRRGEIYGRLLSLSMGLAREIEEYGYTPRPAEVTEAQSWFRRLGHASERPLGPSGGKRNIYIILVESFWDPGRLVNPVIGVPFLAPEFVAAWRENGSALLFAPVYGSGTADTEFELLCGIPAAVVSEGTVFLGGLSNQIPCLPRILRENGYRAFAFHPNKPGYYNRVKQFPAIGFERLFSIDDFRADRMSGPFLADESFFRQSIDMARKNSAGKPYFAYLMTMAGHWPYPWSDSLYQHAFHIGMEPNYNDEGVRELNINLYTSRLIAETLGKLSREDPGALVVVAGDHLPPTAFALASLAGARSSFLSAPVWFETPLLFIDGRARAVQGAVAAFEVGKRILDSVGVPEEARRQFQYFGRPSRDLIRPVTPGKVFRLGPGGFELCDNASSIARCAGEAEWFKHARALGMDLARGKQYSLFP